MHKDTKLKYIVKDPKLQKTKLTEWFEANKKYEEARKLTYCEFPQEWTWDDKNRTGQNGNKDLRSADYIM